MKKIYLGLLCLDVVIVLSVIFIFGIRWVDTADYVGQIENFRHLTFYSAQPWIEFRDFKPLIGTLGMVLPFMSPTALLLGADALFLVGLSILLFHFFSELGFTKTQSLLGSAWVLAGYPGVAFGFSGGTDISGWFFCIASIVAVLAAVRLNNERYLVLASLLGFLGATAKETGVLGLLFGGVYVLLFVREWGWYTMLKRQILLAAPFLVLEGVFFLVFSYANVPSFLQWMEANNALYESVHTVKFFIGSELATFNILWLFIAMGIYALARKKILLSRVHWYQLLALLVAALPVIEWPFFTDRILYIEFIVLVPLALYGIEYVTDAFPMRTWARWGLYALPILCGVFFLIIGGHDGLYALLHQLHISRAV